IAAFQRFEIAFKPLADDRVARFLQHLASEARPLQHGWHVQDRVLRTTPTARVLGTQHFVDLEQRQYREAKGIFHARTPVAVELAAEDAQGVGGSLVAIPAEADIEQIDAEWP